MERNKEIKKTKYHVSHARMSCNHANHTNMQSIPTMQMQKLPERRLKWDRVCLDEPKWA